MKPRLKWAIAGLVIALLAAGTVRTLNARKAQQKALEAQQIAQKTEVSIDLNTTDVFTVKPIDLVQSIPVAGPITAVNTALVKARVPGELQGLNVREGDTVKAGQVLAHIDPTESQARMRQARQQAQAAKAQVDIAQRSFDNNRALVAQGFISSTALASSQATLDGALASLAAAQSGVDLAVKALEDTLLRAPISGQIAQRLAQSGERVAVDARIVEIVDNSRLELEASLNAADSLQVKLGQSAKLRIEGMPLPIDAQVVRINPSATAGSRAVLVYLAIASSPSLRQGLFAEGTLATGTVRALAVPLNAVRTDRPQAYVQVIAQGRVQYQNVELGARSELNEQTMVALTGVPEGTVIMGSAVGSLRAGIKVKIAAQPAGKP